jgi:hypothetical protein
VARLVTILLFLVFVQDWGYGYASHLGEPLGWIYDILLAASPIKIRIFDLTMLAILGMTALGAGKKEPLTPPMRNALLLALGTTATWFFYGVLWRGGDARTASWQTYLILSCILVAFTIAVTFRTPADFYALGKWLIGAALYHAVMCWISYFTWARGVVGESGAYITTHDDTILWVGAILILVVHSIDRRSVAVTFANGLLILVFLGAIQWNSRRLAWVSLVIGLVVLYFLFPPGAAKRRIARIGKYALPIIGLYIAIGWGRQNPIFLPLRSLSSVTTQEDASTLARNAENLGLITTANAQNIVVGTGWGKPYAPVTMKYDISGFLLWQYVPHNSILGLLAFTGILGFAGFWMAVPTAVFLFARVARHANDPRARSTAIVAAAVLFVCLNQLYGDMGLIFLRPMYAIAISYAVALRLPIASGVWPTLRASN